MAVGRRSYGVVSSWDSEVSAPERFATGLADALRGWNDIARVMSMMPAPRNAHPSVSMPAARPLSTVAAELNRCDVAIIHHGVDDGLSRSHRPTGSSPGLLDIVDRVEVPAIIVLHHVPAEPTDDQRRTLARACRSADAVVVTTAPAGVRLAGIYGVDPSLLWLVRSGPTSPRDSPARVRRPTVVTWGVVAPGSGIEWMIDAMELLSAVDLRYLVAGPASDDPPTGEAHTYLDMLIRRCWHRGVPAHVSLGYDDADQTAMTETLRSAVAVVVPQDVAGNQIDGFFEELVAAGVPIVATSDALASAGLPSDAVLLVPRQDPAALAEAVLRIMVDPQLAQSIVRSEARAAPLASWAGMARRFARVADAAIRSSATSRAS